MGRKQNWDEAEVLAAAVQLFRRQGFHGASMRDVEDATGLHSGSLYRAFTSKDELFRVALASYNDRVVRGRVEQHLIDNPDPVAGIRAFFSSTYEDGSGADLGADPGCLLTNTAVESFGLPGSRPGVQQGLQQIETGFADALGRARDLGRLTAGSPVELLAVQLLGCYQGLLVLVRADAPKSKLRTITDGAIEMISAVEEER